LQKDFFVQNLNFPKYDFKLKKSNNSIQIFDSIRKKWIAITPEEWVRQHIIQYLILEKKYPISLIAVEMAINVNQTAKRCDIVLFNRDAKPLVIVECKAPSVELTQKTFDQAAVYNLTLMVDYLLITNGINHYFCKVDFVNKKYDFVKEIPSFEELVDSM
jgi:type I site-specific restriction endonuclease